MTTPFGKPASFNISYTLTSEYRKAQLIATGTEPNSLVKVSYELESLTEAQRALIVEFTGVYSSYFIAIQEEKLISATSSSWAPSEPRIDATNMQFDHILSQDEVFAQMRRMLDDRAALKPQLAEAKAAFRAEQDAKAKAAREAKEKREAEQVAKVAATKEAAAQPIEFKEGKAILNLHQRIADLITGGEKAVVGWIKQTVGIDKTKQDGFMYSGDWVNKGPVEIDDLGKVYLASINDRIYLLTLREGKLSKITAVTNGKGWALVLREKVQQALAEMPTKVEVPVIAITPEARAIMANAMKLVNHVERWNDIDENDPFAILAELTAMYRDLSKRQQQQ